MEPETRDHRIRTDQGELFARTWSPAAGQDRPPILLFHDSLGCVALWRGFPAALASATGHPVIAYDRLGFGRSDAHPGRLDADFIAREGGTVLPLLRQRFGFARFIVCGHSVGGGMAVETAARHPGDCLALVTMGAQAFVEDRTLEGIRHAQRDFAQDDGLSRLARYHGDKAEWVLDAWIGTWLDPGFAGWTLDDAIRRVRCPVLAIHGERDEYGSDEHPRRIAGAGGEAEILPGIGHVPYREDEALVVDIVRRFLERSLPAPPSR